MTQRAPMWIRHKATKWRRQWDFGETKWLAERLHAYAASTAMEQKMYAHACNADVGRRRDIRPNRCVIGTDESVAQMKLKLLQHHRLASTPNEYLFFIRWFANMYENRLQLSWFSCNVQTSSVLNFPSSAIKRHLVPRHRYLCTSEPWTSHFQNVHRLWQVSMSFPVLTVAHVNYFIIWWKQTTNWKYWPDHYATR